MAGKRRADGPAVKKTTANRKPVPTKGRPLLRRLVKWTAILTVVMAVLGTTLVVILYKAIDIPSPNAAFQTETTYVYYSDGKTEVGRYAADQDRNSIPLDQMPETIKDAVVAAEDRSFWTNNGIDLKGILRAALNNARSGDVQGASTITQQYVKILYLTSERSYKRKVKEAVIARKLAEEQTKEQVLEGYLNTIYFGRGAYGIDAAAKAYFGVAAADLTLRQSAVLASVINNPTQFDPANGQANKRALLGRFQFVLDGMAEMGEIDSATAEKAARRLPKFPKIAGDAAYGGQRGHVLDLVKKEMLRLGVATEEQIAGGGLRITTTLTRKAMAAAEAGVKEARPDLGKQLHTAVASVQPGKGALRGFYAGQDYLASQINWAVAGGPPGSTFKPFALAAGLEAGYSLKDTFDGNAPYELPDGKEIGNQGEGEGRSRGRINLVQATQWSVNTAYVDLTLSMPDGPEQIVKTANALGIPRWNKKLNGFNNLYTSPALEPNYAVSLGSATVSPINMANAYATIANGGERADVYVIEKVEDQTGEVLYRHKARTRTAIDSDIASDVSYALQQVVTGPEGTGSKALALGRPVAAKTGTATFQACDTCDNFVSSSWFVGYTPQMATAVMYTRSGDNGKPAPLDGFLEPFYGGTYPAQTWVAVMSRILEGTEVEDFPEPAMVDGEAPEDGHEYVPPKPKPTKKPSKTPTATETPTETESPTDLPTEPTDIPTDPTSDPEPGPDCTAFPEHPLCTDQPTDVASTDAGNPRVAAYREEYAVR